MHEDTVPTRWDTAMNHMLQPSSTSNPTEQLAGSVERVTFHSEEMGFCVLRIKARGHRTLVTVVGTAATITPGEFIECQGAWVTHSNYGLQFQTTHLHVVQPSTLEGMAKYLGSGMVKGIGPHFATKLVRALPGRAAAGVRGKHRGRGAAAG